MSINRYKSMFECDCGQDCGQDYGSCGRRSFFLFEYSRSCDIGTIRIFYQLGLKN
jgi:hypothetical protein